MRVYSRHMRNPLRPRISLAPELAEQVDSTRDEITAAVDDVRTAAVAATAAFALVAAVAIAALMVAISALEKNA
jgi:hypothetical protein